MLVLISTLQEIPLVDWHISLLAARLLGFTHLIQQQPIKDQQATAYM